MTQIGCNISAPLFDLLRAGRAEVDWIKLSRLDALAEELALARPCRPVLLHVLPHAGVRALDGLPLSWAALSDAIRTAGSPHMAVHLEARPSDFDAPVAPPEVVERLVANVAALAARLAVPLLVENVPYHRSRSQVPQCTVEPEVVREVCRRTGAGLLLDLAHARVTAWHRGLEVRDYLRALPLDRVAEIHVCGPAMDAVFGLVDRHQEMQADDYALLVWALEATSARVVTLEYGGTGPAFDRRSDPAALERQLARLREIAAT